MYFEPSKKNYYRFPSSVSIQEFDKKYYFPDKPYANGEVTRMTSKEEQANNYLDNYNIR
jgi:hypothetical protein